jgi:hypothetical protein
MAGGFTIIEYETVKQGFPEFQKVETECRQALLQSAMADWSPQTFGGIKPTGPQFGETTIMPELFRDNANTTLTTWKQNFTALGHQTIMSGANTGFIREDYKIGLCGLAFLDKAIKVSEIKMQISDKKMPRINIDECRVYNKPAIVFEDYWLLDEETAFDLYAFVVAQGQQRIKLLGPQLNKVPNKLMTTNTGAALT